MAAVNPTCGADASFKHPCSSVLRQPAIEPPMKARNPGAQRWNCAHITWALWAQAPATVGGLLDELQPARTTTTNADVTRQDAIFTLRWYPDLADAAPFRRSALSTRSGGR
jgi:hypothetical protein